MGAIHGHEHKGIKKGSKVRYVKGKCDLLGWNLVYTVSQVNVYSYHTDIFLEGFGDHPFNSINFEIAE